MMSDERFFNQVKATMADYSPEVPAAVYGGMRRKLWWSNFTRLSATRLNVWYLALALGAGTAGVVYFSNSGAQAQMSGSYEATSNWAIPTSNTVVEAPVENAAIAAPVLSCSSSCGKSDAGRGCGQTSSTVKSSGIAQSTVENTQPASSENTEFLGETVNPASANTDAAVDSHPAETVNTPAVENNAGSSDAPQIAKKKIKVPVYKNDNGNETSKK